MTTRKDVVYEAAPGMIWSATTAAGRSGRARTSASGATVGRFAGNARWSW